MPLYWVVYGDERPVEAWTPADDFPAVQRERILWQPAGAREPFVLGLEELLRPI